MGISMRTIVLIASCLILSASAIAQARADTALIVALGADNVFGTGKGKHSGGVSPDEAFPAQLETMLHTQGVDARVTNAGEAGDTCPDILARTDSAVPDGTRLVILDRPKGNDEKAGIFDQERGCLDAITNRLTARHIPVYLLPPWETIPGATDNRDMDGHHFTAAGHAKIAEFLVPQVTATLGKHP